MLSFSFFSSARFTVSENMSPALPQAFFREF